MYSFILTVNSLIWLPCCFRPIVHTLITIWQRSTEASLRKYYIIWVYVNFWNPFNAMQYVADRLYMLLYFLLYIMKHKKSFGLNTFLCSLGALCEYSRTCLNGNFFWLDKQLPLEKFLQFTIIQYRLYCTAVLWTKTTILIQI